MSQLGRFKIGIAVVSGVLALCPAANAAVVIFADNFQTDTAGTGNVTTDLDPAIDTGAGDIGSWSNLEGSTGTNFPSGIQVYNDTVPANGIAGTNNFLRTYRGGSTTSAGHPYATGWGAANTTDRVVQLDMSVYQTSGTDPNLPSSNPPVYLHVMFGGAPRANPTQAAWLNTLSAFFGLSTGAASPSNNPDIAFGDDAWHSVKVIANYSQTTTQWGIAPQKYKVFIDGGAPITGDFWTPQTTVQSILVGFGGANEQFHYIDDVRIQSIITPEPAAVCVWGIVIGTCGWVGWKRGKWICGKVAH